MIGSVDNRCLGRSAQFSFADPVGEFNDLQAAGDYVKNAQVRDDAVDDALAGEGERAGLQHLRLAVLGGVYKGKWSLLGDFAIDNDEDLDEAAHRILRERTGMHNVYLEQVKTFGKPGRHPGGRVLTVAYCSLINIQHHELKIHAHELHWHNVSSLKEMAFDHKEILDVCYKWLQKRIQEHPLGFNLLPDKFSLRELQNLYEAILGVSLDKRNFRKKFASMNLLIDTGEMERDVSHRPGKLYKFNFEKYEKNKKKWIGIDF